MMPSIYEDAVEYYYCRMSNMKKLLKIATLKSQRAILKKITHKLDGRDSYRYLYQRLVKQRDETYFICCTVFVQFTNVLVRRSLAIIL